MAYKNKKLPMSSAYEYKNSRKDVQNEWQSQYII